MARTPTRPQDGRPDDAGARLATAVERWNTLRDQRIRAEADLERATADLEGVRAEARAEHGTDDPDELDRIATNARSDALAAVEAFEADMDAIEAALEAIARGCEE